MNGSKKTPLLSRGGDVAAQRQLGWLAAYAAQITYAALIIYAAQLAFKGAYAARTTLAGQP